MERITQVINSILEYRHESAKRWIGILERRLPDAENPDELADSIEHYRTEVDTIEQIMDDFRDAEDRLETVFWLDADDLPR